MARRSLKRTLTRRQPTIETVAELAGVSAMTVSRVLRDSDKVAATTRRRVEVAMRELGYVHNRLAGALAASRSTQVAVVMPTLRNSVFTEVLAGIASGLEGSGYQPVIGIAEYDRKRKYELLNAMMAWRPAGVILANIRHHADTTRILQRAEVPVVEVMGLTRDPIDMSVGIDHGAVGRDMATHLIERGYRRFAYLGTDHAMDRAALRRYRGFCQVLKRHDAHMLATLTVPELMALRLGRAHCAALLTEAPTAELVYCSNDAVAAGVLMYCQSTGIDVPQSLGIASFGGLEIGAAMPVPITTIEAPLFDIGRQSAERVLSRLQGRRTPRVTNAGYRLVEGASS